MTSRTAHLPHAASPDAPARSREGATREGATRERAAVLEPLLERMSEALRTILASAPLEILREASAAQTGAGSLAAVVSRLPEANPALAGADPEAAAVARARAMKQRLLESVPTLTTAEVAAQLGVTEAAVRKARKEGRLLAVEFGAQQRYPAFQLSADGIRPEMRKILAALDEVPITSDWVRLDFLTAPDAAEEDGRSVVELLQDGDVTEALTVIRRYGETGA